MFGKNFGNKFVVGEYLVEYKRIGKGAFSSVYRGYHQETNKIVAIKKIELDTVKKIKQRIKKEIQICKMLKHPNVIETYDVINDKIGGNIYIVMEYCGEGHLGNLLKNKPIIEEEAKKYMKQIAEGLKYLMDNSILHRDLKPQNIMINDENNLKIADFGFARHFQTDTVAETLCGTPLYMAPEIMKHRKYNYKSDLWSVGVILYQMVFGRRPYYANNILDLLKKIENDKLYYPDDVDISYDCKNLIESLLHTNPDKRIEWKDFFNHSWIEIDKNESNKISININDSFEDTLQKINEQSNIGSQIYDNIDLLQESGFLDSDESRDYLDEYDSENEVENTKKIGSINLDENYIKPVKEHEEKKDYVYIKKSAPIKIINKEQRSRYFEEETDNDEEDTPNQSNLKGYFNKSINYLKTSMFNFNTFKHSSM